ncbi:MAG: hypothetical protein LBR75_04400 [Prevotellaceae bacterium]|jgi:hypothetical protein|nr:hypothetical protein [Prevotellaceae bacterium]
MPYRRLPNTDQARVRALQMAYDAVKLDQPSDKVVSYKAQNDARAFLASFERTLTNYRQTLKQQISDNKKYKNDVKTARLYVSHFIQVLNFAVLRGEIKKELKTLYKLKEDSFALPDLSTEAALQRWGLNIIEGERMRKQQGGTGIYNPTISNVQVYFDAFERQYNAHKINRSTNNRYLENIIAARREADRIILDIWNQVEEKFVHLDWDERIKRCAEYGVIYYYRRGEEKPQEMEAISFME